MAARKKKAKGTRAHPMPWFGKDKKKKKYPGVTGGKKKKKAVKKSTASKRIKITSTFTNWASITHCIIKYRSFL